MEAVVIATTLVGSMLGALALQKIALESLFRAMSSDRRDRR